MLRDLPGAPGFLVTVRDDALLARRREASASGCQDHATWPYAVARSSACTGARFAPGMLRAAGVHRIPRSTFVTTAIRPLDEAGQRDTIILSGKTKEKSFSPEDWRGLDRGDHLVTPMEIAVCAQAPMGWRRR
ncbi:MAG: hypothetical protein WA418_37350 [Bradyrhizobium sp.]